MCRQHRDFLVSIRARLIPESVTQVNRLSLTISRLIRAIIGGCIIIIVVYRIN